MMPFFAEACSKHFFFFLPPWWEYLETKKDAFQCSIAFNFPNDLLAVGLGILDILLRLAGFVAVVSIIIAGFEYQFTGGNPEAAAKARKRIINSIFGLAIALTATAFVNFVGRQLIQ